jgi:hypothetical protein
MKSAISHTVMNAMTMMTPIHTIRL